MHLFQKKLAVTRVLFRCLVNIYGTKEYVRFGFAIRDNGTNIIDKNINKNIFSLTVLGKTNREKR